MNEEKTQQNETYVTRRIGNTIYKVKVCFSDTEKESMEEKILRMIRNEVLSDGSKGAIMEAPQMSRPA